MAVVDTSVLVPLFDADHPAHARARRLVEAPGTLHVTGGVLAELTTVLRRRGKDVGLDGDRIARDAVASMEKLRGFRNAADYDADAVSRIYRARGALSYVDAWGVALALELDEGLLTFDARQRAALRQAARAKRER